MLPYWIMFLVPVLGWGLSYRAGEKFKIAIWGLTIIVFIIFVGLRGDMNDYYLYLERFNLFKTIPINNLLDHNVKVGDSGYDFLNWIIGRLGLDFVFVNLIGAILLMYALNKFAMRQPNPWLTLIIAFPYIIVVLGMAMTRQSFAFAFIILSIISLSDERKKTFIFFIACASVFHISACFIIFLLFLSDYRMKPTITFMALFGITVFFIMNYGRFAHLYFIYIGEGQHMDSLGIWFRFALNCFASIILLRYSNLLTQNLTERRIYKWLSIFTILILPIAFISTTFVDRVIIYFMPVQLFVFSRITFLTSRVFLKRLLASSVFCTYCAVLFVWLEFAWSAAAWLPYRMFFNNLN